MNNHLLHQIDTRLSLREPQRESLRRLADVLDRITLAQETDLAGILATVRAAYPDVTDFERGFPSLCFALATGVGKTRLMGAFIAYLYLTRRSRNFFVLAPNLTIYEKLIKDFTQYTEKYVFKGIAEFARAPPRIVTGDTYREDRGPHGQGEMFAAACVINIFNISKINSEMRGGRKPRIKRLQEALGESYFDSLSNLSDLVLLMDEAHRYRATAGVKAINELKPVLGLELTATPKGFKNVLLRYDLGDAMADGFVKEPAVATRVNFRPQDYKGSRVDLDRIKLEDGVHYHEFVKVRLDLYARRTGRPPVHPFMLVVADSIDDAKELRALIEADTFFEGRYKDRVIEVHSGQGAAEREKSERQLLALETDKTIEIVIHVNQLNEGWDVKNLYTIVPLRAFAAAILTEQTLGRGLRLPYGERTGDDAVDRLTVIAHDHFDEIIRRARLPGAITMRAIRIGDGGDVPASSQETVPAKPVYETKTIETLAGSPGGFGDAERRTVEIVHRVIDEEARHLTGGFKELTTPKVQARIAARVGEIAQSTQGALDVSVRQADVARVVGAYTSSLIEHSIEIPEIVVLPPIDERAFGFNDFDLTGLDRIGVRPIEGAVVVEDLRTGTRVTIRVDTIGAKEPKLEHYIFRRFAGRNDMDCDRYGALLLKLARQMVDHFGTYLKEAEVEAVLRVHAAMLADFIFAQMMEPRHHWETPAAGRRVVCKGFVRLGEDLFRKERDLPLHDFRRPVTPRGDTRKYLFTGFSKCALDVQRFHSDDERRFAVLIDRREPAVKVWIKPGSGVFQIATARGEKYEPDFLVETTTDMLICEVKSASELQDPIVTAKTAAARAWIGAANAIARDTGRKPWRYALIPHNAVIENATLEGLLNLYEQPAQADWAGKA
ncbi:MAG: DEAD/DEAH box helicase [Hyphomicrobiaceae bacterium]